MPHVAPRSRRPAIALLVALALPTPGWGGAPAGPWSLTVEDPRHRPVATLVVEFTAQKADSCLGGNWQQLKVLSATTSDPGFFPVHDPLSYAITGDKLVIGRNQVCDNYLQLSGRLGTRGARGDYHALGLGGPTPRGSFALTPRARQ